MLSLLWLIFVFVLSVVLHELAHAFAVKASGFEVDAIRFGLGKPIRKWRWNDIEISIGYPATLAVAAVEYSDRGRGTIPQKIFIAAAGVLANVALMVLADKADSDPHLHAASNYWALLGVANLIIVVINLLPISFRRYNAYTKQWSDGGIILGLLQEQFTGRNFTERR
ncbi:MAG: site-2 protease family protein [Capsulimonas sp.]|uniref:site-2 protease family protein n=1 Tax=Capsulimonas sp. TaxID=2494211 RepID=UPI003266A4DC